MLGSDLMTNLCGQGWRDGDPKKVLYGLMHDSRSHQNGRVHAWWPWAINDLVLDLGILVK